MKITAFAYKNTPDLLNISSSGGAFLVLVQVFSEMFGGLDIPFAVPNSQMIFE